MSFKNNYNMSIGSSIYLTKDNGLDGVLKYYPEDFIVDEVSAFKESINGKYLILELKKKNWDLNHFIKFISKILGISSKRIGFAGTKDKRALTTQKISIFDISEEKIKSLSIKDVELTILGHSNKQIEIGDLIKNRFEIIIRFLKLNPKLVQETLDIITKEIILNNGVPNYYGIQRFGEKRTITHLVGYYLLKRDFKSAIMTYLTYLSIEEEENATKMRKYILETEDFKGALKICPQYLGPEKSILNTLIASELNFQNCLLSLPKNLCMMFIHAYQSQLFNCIISDRLKFNMKLNEAVIGDIVCYQNTNKIPDSSKLEEVTEHNLQGINNLIKRGRAYITAPLIGYNTLFATGKPGLIEKDVFQRSKLNLSNFNFIDVENKKIDMLLSSKGTRKEILLSVIPKYKVIGTLEDFIVKMNFELPKGSYATTVLREYIKNKK